MRRSRRRENTAAASRRSPPYAQAYSQAGRGRQRPGHTQAAGRPVRGLPDQRTHPAVRRRVWPAPDRSRPQRRRVSADEKGASGGMTRASARIAMDMGEQRLDARTRAAGLRTACGSSPPHRARAASPCCQARGHRSALRLAVAEMQPANAPARASSSTASVDGNTLKLGAIAAASRANGHVAGGILEARRCGAECSRAAA